ncbi:DUF1517 domain-containing protein [Phormidium tenue FACHB-886]|nr:DUF1517 domain-containing protein [Phormidium tenue FACHB-886]
MQLRSIHLLSTTLLAFALVNSLGADLQTLQSGQLQLNGDRVEARSSGARSRSGSFRRSSPSSSRSSSSGSSSSSPSRSTRSNSPDRSSTPRIYQTSPAYPSAPVIIHSNSNAAPTSSTTDAEDWVVLVILVLLILGGFGVGVMVFYLLKRRNPSVGELENDVVTVTKLQVALLAEAKQLQTDLTQLALEVDTTTPEGMNQLLQESVLALLRSPENWTHTAVSSQILNTREAAEQLFEQLSIAERSKFDVEVLANVGGRVRQKALRLDESESAAYIVVTLLIGTENDRPLIEQVHTAEELQTALQQIAAISPPSLSVFELLWSPQDAADSLTYDELLTEYTNLIQIA